MKLVVVSDTHGDRAILKTILAQQPHADGYFYAGDSELSANDPLFDTYQAVAGNMDFDPGYPLTLTKTIDGVTIFMTHGHRFGVNFGLNQLIEAGSQAKAQLVFFGHTHQLGVEKHANMVVLNPGSISQPRGQYANLGGTYAVVAVSADKITVQFIKRDGSAEESLTREFKR